MTRQAAKILQEFYLKLRDRNMSADGTPITARKLESLVRLAEARARIELREEITVQDAMVSSFSTTAMPHSYILINVYIPQYLNGLLAQYMYPKGCC